MGPRLWEELVRARVDTMGRMRRAADAAAASAPTPQPRLEAMRDLYAWFEESAAAFLAERWPGSR